MEFGRMERTPVAKEIINYQLDLLRGALVDPSYPAYPAFADRLVVDLELLQRLPDGRLILPDGAWTVDEHPNRPDKETVPTPEVQEEMARQGLELDARGRPLHPWLSDMVGDPGIGILTGKGAYWHWGPNYTADPIIIKDGHVLLVRRKDTGELAFPGGFINENESAFDAARREAAEETTVELPPASAGTLIYDGPVVDIRMTANAWGETSAVLFQVNDGVALAEPQGQDDAESAAWVPLETAQNVAKFFGAHRFLLQRAIDVINGNLEGGEIGV